MTTVHHFTKSLSRSHAYSDAPWWADVYREAFPNLAAMVDLRDDGWAQRGGIDRQLTLSDGTVLKVDEKVRDKDYGDILLERWSDKARSKPGWVQKPLTCDYIAYAVVPSFTCYLLPFQLLRRAWRQQGRRWVELAESPDRNGFRIVPAQNPGYVTESVAVPLPVLLDAIRDAIVVTWSPAVAA